MKNKNTLNNLVIRKENKILTTSLLVAKKFSKQHKDVLEKIRDLINEIRTAENSADLFCKEFIYIDNYKRKQPAFEFDKDFFTLLVMSFTGEKALNFKIDYINAFNELQNKQEQTLTIPQLNLEFVAEFINLSNRVINILDDKQTTISFQDLITLSKKGMSAEAHNMLTVKSVSDTGNIYSVVKDLKGFASFSQNYINTFTKVDNKLSIKE